MLKHSYIFVSLLISVLITSCGPMYNTEYTFIPPKSDMSKMCTAQCIQGKNACQQNCRLVNENCAMKAQHDAMFEFNQYKEEQIRRGLPVNKSVRDFERSSGCNTSCNCEPTFRSCYSACGGEVEEKQVCVAFCDKKQP